jgi:PAS domain S-box-containing protein
MKERECILIVDDDEDTRGSLSLILEKKGYEIEAAGTGREALEKAKERCFNVALLDLQLPDMGGIELLASLKKMHPAMALLMVTGHASLKSAIQVMDEGAAGYLTKPLDMDEVLYKLGHALEMQRLVEEKRRTEEALRQRNRELELLNRANRVFISSLDLDQVLATILQEVRHLLGVAASSAWLFDLETGELVCRQATGPNREIVRGWRLEPGKGIAGWVARAGQSLIVPDAQADEHYFEGVAQQTEVEIRSMLCVPLRVKGDVIGVIEVVDTTVDRFSTADQTLLESLAASAAIVIENARLYEESERLRDFNTSILETMGEALILENREGLITFANRRAQTLLGYSEEELLGQPRSVIMLLEEQEAVAGQSLPSLPDRPNTYEACLLTKDAREIPVLVSGMPFTQGGRSSGTLTIFTDVTRLKRAEKEIRQLGQFLEGVIESTNVWLDVLDEKANVVLWNRAAEEISGYSQEEVMGHDKIWEWLYPDEAYRNRVLSDAFAVIEGDYEDIDRETIIRCKDGQTRIISWNSRRLLDEKGTPMGSIAIGRDVTERKRAQEALVKSEAFNRRLVEASPLGIFYLDATGIITYENPAMRQMMGVPEEAESPVIGKSMFELPLAKDANILPLLEQCLAGETIVGEVTRYHSLMGPEVDLEIHAASLTNARGEWDGAIVMVRDITARVRAEEKIRRRNRELELLNRIIAASTSDLGPEAILEIGCRELAQAFEVPQAAATLLNEEKTAAEVVAEHRAGGQPSGLHTIILVADNPWFQHLLTYKAPVAVEDAWSDPRLAPLHGLMHQFDIVSLLVLPLLIKGEVVGGLGLATTELHHFSAEEISLAWSVADQLAGALARIRLAQIQRRLTTAIEQAAESAVITDAQGIVLYVNPAFEQITGYNWDEAVGQSMRILKSGKHDAAFYRELWTTISAAGVWHGRIVNKKKDGTLYTVDTTISPVRDENGDIVNYVSLQRDVTSDLQLEEQYRQAQKMEAIGRLTAGIAHDFNNLLTAINGFAELAQFRLPPDDPVQELVGKVQYSGQRAASLVRQLLAFSRKQILEPQVLDLNAVVNDLNHMLQRIIGEDIQLKISLTPGLWPVKVDVAQIEQVIVNLAVNARDAMPRGGQLAIETANAVLDESYLAHHLEARLGEHILLAVGDTGIGMSPEVKTHLFEPFFTTKERGRGTGLGLATVYGIVKQSGGHIWVYSEEGIGTTFKIYLPRAQGATRRFVWAEAAGVPPSGSETILLVEDDANVRELVQRVLQGQGYTLLTAPGAQEALGLAAQHSGLIHLLLVDVVMPDMSGQALVRSLARTYPDLKILFMSGYTDEIIAHHGVLDPDVAFLQKPFNAMTLARKVRQVLDAPQQTQLSDSSQNGRRE